MTRVSPRLLAGLLFFVALPAAAQTAPAVKNSAQPIEITATKTVEWLRNDKQYVARENVIVTQGAMTLKSDLLTADYRESPASSMEIWQMTADGNVTISDEGNTAYGDKAVYDVTGGVATLTGGDLKLVSPDQTVTAQEKMEYHANERKALAVGKAKVVRAKDTLSADTLVAYFKESSNVQPAATQAPSESVPGVGSGLDRLEALGNVVIKTPTETLYGNKGTYRASTNTAELAGKVRIERGPNILEGDRAEVDLNTNVSKLFGNKETGGRVRGVFFPGSENKDSLKGQDKKPAPVTQTPPAAPVPAPVTPATPAQQAAPAESAVKPAPAPAMVSPRVDY